jgi:hypothetical protein
LIRNTSKRRMGIMAFMAGLLLFGHWLDFFLMIKPGVWHEMQAHAAHSDEHEEGHSETITLGEAKAMFTENTGEHQTEQHAHEDHGEAAHAEGEHDDHGAEAHGHDDTHATGDGHDAHGHSDEFAAGFHMPGGIEIGMMLGFLGLYLFVFFTSLTKASFVPKNDPYLDESEHHNYDVQGF